MRRHGNNGITDARISVNDDDDNDYYIIIITTTLWVKQTRKDFRVQWYL